MFAAAGQCGTIQSSLTAQGAAASKLQDAITGKAPTETKGIAQQLASQLAQEQGKTRFLKANEELRRLQVKLSRL